MPDTGAIVAIVIPVVIIPCLITFITWSCVINHKHTKPVREAMVALVPIHVKPPSDKEISPKSPEYQQAIRLSVQQDTQQRVNARLAEESRTANGEPVWFAYQIKSGGLRHYSLLTLGYKYELVPVTSLPFGGDRDDAGALLPKPVQWTVEEELRLCASAPCDVNGEGDTMLSLIGWTAAQHMAVQAASDNALAKIGTSITAKDEHKYFRSLASEVVTQRADDFNWFLLCTTSDKQLVNKQPYTPPLAVAATWLQRMQKVRSSLTPDQVAVLDHNASRLSHYISERKLDYITQIIHSDRKGNPKAVGRPSGLYVSSRGYGGGRIDWSVATGRGGNSGGSGDTSVAIGGSASGDGGRGDVGGGGGDGGGGGGGGD